MSTKAAIAPKHILSDLQCPGMENGIREHLMSSNEWTTRTGHEDADGNYNRPAMVIEWPKASGQLVWHKGTYDGDDVSIQGFGVAYLAKVQS